MISTKLKGMKTALANLDRKNAQIAHAVHVGLKHAGLYLQGQAQRLVPVNTGNLKNSADTRPEGYGWSTKVQVVFTASYALYVHEAPMKLKGVKRPKGRGRYWDPQGRATRKFLERPARTKRKQMVKIVQKRVTRVVRGR